MTARTVPTPPTFALGEELTSTKMNQLATWMNFWSNKPMFRMYQTSSQNITTGGSGVQVTMDTPDYDTDSGRAGGTPWSYTIPAGMGGRWRFNWMVPMGTSSTGARQAYLARNGTRVPEPTAEVGADTDSTNPTMSATIAVNAGDVMSIWAWQNSGGTITTNVTPARAFFEGELVSLGSP